MATVMIKLEVRDKKTGELFSLNPTEDRAILLTSDGDKIRVHPVAVRQFVGKGKEFDGSTVRGPRTLERLK
jgi:hypothetical protein